MKQDQTDQRLAELEARLGHIERRLGITSEEAPPQSAQSEIAPQMARQAEISTAVSALNEPVIVLGPEQAIAQPAQPPPVPLPLPAVPPTPVSVLPYAARIEPPSPVANNTIEQAIGLKWAGWIGAVVVVIGAGYFIKFAYDQGWFGALPAAARLFLMSLGGFALIAAGEWVYRKINNVAAAALYGAGVATLFFVSHAGHAYYGLYQRETAFIMMGLTTVIGAAVAMRGRLVSIAVLALIGGNLAPLVLRGDISRLAPFLSYLLMLQVVALSLAWWGGTRRWWMLRYFSLVTTSLWMTQILLVGKSDPLPLMEIVFSLIFAVMFQIELILSSTKWKPDRTSILGDQHPGATFSLLVTGALTGALLLATVHQGPIARGIWLLSLATACASFGTVLVRGGAESIRTIARSLRIQAAGLLVLTVPIMLDGAPVSIAWAVLALAFALLGSKLDLKLSRLAAVATWLLAAFQLWVWGISKPDADNVVFHLLTQPLEARLLVAWTLVGFGQIIGWIIAPIGDAKPQANERQKLSFAMEIASSLLFIFASILWLQTLAATTAIIIYAWAFALLYNFDQRISWLLQAAGVLAVALVKWVIIDTLQSRFSPGWSAVQYQPVFNPQMALGGLIAISIVALGWLHRGSWAALSTREPAELRVRDVLLVTAAAVVALLAFALSLEIDRVIERASTFPWPPWQIKHLAWSMLWTISLAAFAGLIIRIEPLEKRREPILSFLGMLMLMLTAKYLFVDTLLWRLQPRFPRSPVGANLQVLTAIIVVGGLVGLHFVTTALNFKRLSVLAAMLVMLWAGSMEIDRAFIGMSRHVALSIFWALFAIGSVIAGFQFRAAHVRYFGLTLFALTLIKVLLIDLEQARTGYRIISCIGVGLLLIGTSVLYGKLSPHLLANAQKR